MFQIKSKIKSALIIFVVTIIVYVTYDNLQKIEAQRNLPVGVTEVEISDWVKTREVDEIGDYEKKLNSHVDLVELNQNVSIDDVQAIDGLYDDKWNLSSIPLLNGSTSVVSQESAENSEEGIDVSQENTEISEETTEDIVQASITGNKVLRTIVNTGTSSLLRYNIEQLSAYLKSDTPVVWSENGTVTWNLWTSVDDKKTAIEWRMISGKFNLSYEQLQKIKSRDAHMLLGIPADNDYGFELIIPYNDIISVFVNEKPTSINYTSKSTLIQYYLNSTRSDYKYTAGSNYCKNEYHNELSNHTDGNHVDTNVLDQSGLLDCEILNNLKSGENTIDILIGNIIISKASLNNSNGFSKLNLYIIESPKINISAQFYKYENEEIVYFDENYLPKKDEKVYLRIDVENKSTITLNNLDLTMKINSQLPLEINGNDVFYDNQDITSKTRCYINEDFSNKYTIDELKSINPAQKMTIMSDDINYTITQQNCKDKYVYIESVATLNYIRDELTYIDSKKLETGSSSAREKRIRIPVSSAFGCLNISCSVEGENLDDTSFMLNISSSDDFANLLIKLGQTCKLNDLSLSEYDINLIVPQDYQVVDTDTYSSSIQNKVSLNSTNYEKNIQIKLKKKNNPYFYKNNQESVSLSFK